MGLATIKHFSMLYCYQNGCFLAYFGQLRLISFYICYKIGRFKFGGRLGGLKSKLLINKMIQTHICCKIGRSRFGGRMRGLKI